MIRTSFTEGYNQILDGHHGEMGLRFGLLKLTEGSTYNGDSGGCELALVILQGRCDLAVLGAGGQGNWRNLGSRRNVFDGKATSAYIPPNASYHIIAKDDVEIAIGGAPVPQEGCEAGLARNALIIRPEDVVVHDRGRGSYSRQVHDIIADDIPARRLVVGETFGRSGAWSSYPPHKHDVNNPPHEVKMEEVYFFRIQPAQGFGVQIIYEYDDEQRPQDKAYVVRNNDLVFIGKGYHPVAVSPGYEIYYLWILAGEPGIRRLTPYDDENHKWVMGQTG